MASVTGFTADEELPDVRWTPSTTQLFLYSAATRNPHRIHYEAAFARSEGIDGVLVQGPLHGAKLRSYLEGQLREGLRLTRLDFRNLRPVVVGEEVTLRGHVTGTRERKVEFRVWEELSDGGLAVEGAAVAELITERDLGEGKTA